MFHYSFAARLLEAGSDIRAARELLGIATGQYNFWTWENNIKPGPWIPFP
jgi:hypothetical protein